MINTFLIVIMSVFLNSCREEDPYQGKCQNIPEVFFHYTGKLYKEGKYSGKFKDCMLDSTWTWYYDNGQKEQEMYFKNGVPIGKIYVWYSNGQLKTEYEGIGKRSGVELIYYPSGIKQYERTYKNDTLKKIVEFYENGVKKSYTEYLELGINNGKNESWDEKGNKISEAYFIHNKVYPHMRVWYSNGKLRFTCDYNKDGMEDGKWIEYDEKGNITKERTYKNGVLTDEKIPNPPVN